MLTEKNNTLDDHEQNPPRVYKELCLLLLELYVKQASGDRLAELNQMFSVPTSIYFEILDFVDENDLTLTSVDPFFQSQVDVVNEVQVFNVGKSVLFAIDSETAMNPIIKMILKIKVKKQMPDDIKPDVLVGTGELDLSKQFAALRIEMMQDWNNITSKEFDGQIPLIYNGKLSANLDIFVRISSLGQINVTEFDIPTTDDPSTFVFGTREANQRSSYKCREVNSRSIDILKNSSQDLQKSVTYSTYMPEKYSCVPCGKLGAVEEIEYKTKKEKKDNIAEKKLANILSKSSLRCSPYQPYSKSVVLKISRLFDTDEDNENRRKPTVTVVTESEATKSSDSPDLDHDIFVLRIGKKGLVGVGEKADIQLEMKTPKGPEKRPPIRYETRDTQTEKHDEKPLIAVKKKIKKKKRKK
ncbi:hypothetical protein PUN28_018691 [Cardiocondyla obscurior]|uniref:Uncharacterized protein n=1 Tax=Cardiocondyla obscurior TaxID=286306 RepID=A0AAW2EH58_9HYME